MEPAKLDIYLSQKIEGFRGPIKVRKFSGGQSNPTFLLTTPSGKYVLRRKPPGTLLQSAHAVDREFAVLKALSGSQVPVARPLHLCTDDAVIGSMFYVMSFEDGQIFWDPALPNLDCNSRGSVYEEIIRVLAALHSIDVHEVGLSEYGRPGNYFERQLVRWEKQYRAAELEQIDEMERLIGWLRDALPTDDGPSCLIHGDYRIDNLIFASSRSSTGTGKIRAVLDWELSTLGHPMADLGYFCMCLRLPSMGQVQGLMGIDRNEIGVPAEQALIEQYCALRGLSGVENWTFYLAFAFFRLAAIAQGVFKRALDGNASNAKAREIGKMVTPLAQLALTEISEKSR